MAEINTQICKGCRRLNEYFELKDGANYSFTLCMYLPGDKFYGTSKVPDDCNRKMEYLVMEQDDKSR